MKRKEIVNIENYLKRLFNYQRFAKVSKLASQINHVHQRYDHESISLNEADLSFVAGGKKIEEKKDEKDFEKKQD